MSSPSSPPDPVRLSDRERSALAAIAAHEHRADAAFANRLAAGRPPGRWTRRLAVSIPVAVAGLLVMAGVLPFIAPAGWAMVVVALVLVVAMPAALVGWALRQGEIRVD
jgi:hypothetical protein